MLFGRMETSDLPRLPKGWNAFLIQVAWNNPYTEPPEGWPRVLAEAALYMPPGKGCPPPPKDLTELVGRLGFGSGWGLRQSFVPHPIKHWSNERRFAYRRKRLEARIRKKYPLFEGEMVQEMMARKPEYYGLTTASPLPAAR